MTKKENKINELGLIFGPNEKIQFFQAKMSQVAYYYNVIFVFAYAYSHFMFIQMPMTKKEKKFDEPCQIFGPNERIQFFKAKVSQVVYYYIVTLVIA